MLFFVVREFQRRRWISFRRFQSNRPDSNTDNKLLISRGHEVVDSRLSSAFQVPRLKPTGKNRRTLLFTMRSSIAPPIPSAEHFSSPCVRVGWVRRVFAGPSSYSITKRQASWCVRRGGRGRRMTSLFMKNDFCSHFHLPSPFVHLRRRQPPEQVPSRRVACCAFRLHYELLLFTMPKLSWVLFLCFWFVTCLSPRYQTHTFTASLCRTMCCAFTVWCGALTRLFSSGYQGTRLLLYQFDVALNRQGILNLSPSPTQGVRDRRERGVHRFP